MTRSSVSRAVSLGLVLALASACGDDGGGATRTDAGPRADGAPLDSAPRDAGPTPLDSGPDALDAGAPGQDAGLPADAGPPVACAARYTTSFPAAENQQGLAAAVERSTGAVVITGRNQGVLDLGDGPFDAMGSHDVFVVKLDAAGSPVWSRHFRDSGDDSEPHGIAVAPDGTVVVAGYVKNDIDLGLGVLAPRTRGVREIFVLALEPGDGATRWARRYGLGTGWAVGFDGAGDVYVTGDASGEIDFGGPVRRANGQSDVFVLHLAAAGGAFLAQHLYGGPNLDVAYAIAVEADGAFTVGGQSYGLIDFGDGPTGEDGTNSGFVARVDASGNPVYRQVGGDTAEAHALAALPDGGVIVQTRGTVDRLDGAGTRLWRRALPGSPLTRAVAVDGAGGVWVTGGGPMAAAACTGFPEGGYATTTRLSIEDGSTLDARGASGSGEVAAWSVGLGPDLVVIAGWLAGASFDFGGGPVGPADNDVFAVGYPR